MSTKLSIAIRSLRTLTKTTFKVNIKETRRIWFPRKIRFLKVQFRTCKWPMDATRTFQCQVTCHPTSIRWKQQQGTSKRASMTSCSIEVTQKEWSTSTLGMPSQLISFTMWWLMELSLCIPTCLLQLRAALNSHRTSIRIQISKKVWVSTASKFCTLRTAQRAVLGHQLKALIKKESLHYQMMMTTMISLTTLQANRWATKSRDNKIKWTNTCSQVMINNNKIYKCSKYSKCSNTSTIKIPTKRTHRQPTQIKWARNRPMMTQAAILARVVSTQLQAWRSLSSLQCTRHLWLRVWRQVQLTPLEVSDRLHLRILSTKWCSSRPTVMCDLYTYNA